jgi:phenylacetate-CoA ligase
MAHPRDRYTAWVANVLFPLHERLKGHDTRERLSGLEASQWLDRERLEALQLRNLRAFLADIGARVPYYQQLFAAAGLAPGDVKSLSDLAKVPFLPRRSSARTPIA